MPAENEKSFLVRFYIYQKERFPFLAHGLLISAFTFSAISYSRICRQVDGFIGWQDFIIGVFATITLFFLVRIFDEFKDQKEDAAFRSYLPVPRGLVSLKELKKVGLITAAIQIAVIAFYQWKMLYLYMIVIGYLLLMGVEFFVPEWLKKRHLLYITSHMVIIPLIDIYSSGLDWLMDGSQPHWGLGWFFAVSYMNGLVLEFGRKLRTPEAEEKGVLSYTKMYGTKKGVFIWMALMFVTMLIAMGACYYAEFSFVAYLVLGVSFVLCSLPGWLFLKSFSEKKTKYMEYTSALWTILMYLSLGGIPMIKYLVS